MVLTGILRCGAALALMIALLAIPEGRAETPLRDPNLPSVSPEALQLLVDNRIRQKIIQESLAPYRGRCVCPEDVEDSNGKPCGGRHELITTDPKPLCYPHQVTDQMIQDWRHMNPDGK
jgi:hypothetical protein